MPQKSNAVELVSVFGKKSRVDFHTVAALILTHRYEVSSRQRSMIGRDVKNKNYDKINLIEKTWRKNNEYNITYHGSWYRQPIWNGN